MAEIPPTNNTDIEKPFSLHLRFRRLTAALLALVKYDAPEQELLEGVETLEAFMRTEGFGGAAFNNLLAEIKDGGFDRDRTLDNLRAVSNPAGLSDAMFRDWILTEPSSKDPLPWLYRIKDLLSSYSSANMAFDYTAVVGCLEIAYKWLVDQDLTEAAFAINPFVDMCCESPREGIRWCFQQIDALLNAYVNAAQDSVGAEVVKGLIENNKSKKSFRRFSPSAIRMPYVPSILILTPDDYTADEHAYAYATLRSFLTRYTDIRFIRDLENPPDDCTDTVLVWPGRCSLVAPMDPRSARCFVDDDEKQAAHLPRWMKRAVKEGRTTLIEHVPPGATVLDEETYVPMIDRPIGGLLSRKMELATVVIWEKEAFEYLLDRIAPDLTYNNLKTYDLTGLGETVNIHEVASRVPPVAFYLKNKHGGSPLSTAVNRCTAPDILLMTGDMTTEETSFVRDAMSAHLSNTGNIVEIDSTGSLAVEELSETVVVWPPRVVPVRPLDVRNLYHIVKEDAAGSLWLDPAAPQWLDRNIAGSFLSGAARRAEGHDLWISSEHLVFVHGLVFGRTARLLETVSLVGWVEGALPYLQDVLNDAFTYLHAV